MDTIKLIVCTVVLLSSIIEFIKHRDSEKYLLWLILFWVIIN